MKCPESDTCQETCSHKGEHKEMAACGLGKEITTIVDCPQCIDAAEELRRKLEGIKGDGDAKDL